MFKLELGEVEMNYIMELLDLSLKKDGISVLTKVVPVYNVLLQAIAQSEQAKQALQKQSELEGRA